MDVANLISGSSAFSKVHILLKPCLENFEHYFVGIFDECSCGVVWAFFGIAFLWDWNENWPFPAAAAKSLQSCPTLCNPIDGSPSGSAVPGILQARTLEWVGISFSNAWKWKVKSEVAQSYPTLSDPMDCSLPGSSIHGIFQARVLAWGATAFS